jgi:biopolymer transport protein ExbB/TolQ
MKMKLSTLLFLVVLAVAVAFSIANWGVIMAPTDISLIVASVRAPLGLILLGLVLVVTVLFLGYLVYLQTSVLLESRRHARELDAQRQLADQAEASRFTDLRGFVEQELKSVVARIDRSEQELKATVERAGNTLSAYIGELEDRLERREGGRP